jgi:hypothetical protein
MRKHLKFVLGGGILQQLQDVIKNVLGGGILQQLYDFIKNV